ncbi:Protein of unknown function (DUF3644) [Thermodesulfobium acidiphilum]|uniref:DUF3644 domain-containing protein n=1 Tax=Thermodesulfobium acidiphilum TaxID=1794699 RepID=A0A2R4W250_THEAF|nr:DUF3644 domain-containing protein [Thermodesulfobium acidiphilum]AWB10778.1 Protein of unknown function (DUF3644) [Thermodesulfobium acidiphilum]
MRGEPIKVKQLLQKARDSAILAVEFYNKPAVSFKSGGYITMMCIAWTSLFHAYFLKNKIKPFYREKNSDQKKPRFEQIIEKLPDDQEIKENKWWELQECVKQYFKDNNPPVRKNLEFFIPLRNKIVHRNLPELDDSIFGECQALLINFNNFMEQNFGEKYSIKNSLSFSLQLARSPKNFIEASKNELKKNDAQKIVNFIKTYRSSLTTDQFESPEYSFKALLIQVRNHGSRDALALEFINEKDLTEEQKEKLKIGTVLIKEKKELIDGIPNNFQWTYKELRKEIKTKCPHIKQTMFNKLNRYLRERYKNKLAYERVHNPKSEKKASTWYYDPKIIEEFKKIYPPITPSNEQLVKRIEDLVDKIDAAKKENPQADTQAFEKEIDQLVHNINYIT